MSISAVVLTKNSQAGLDRCLGSLAWCDEIIIIDDYSNQKPGIKIFQRHLNGNFAAQRNYGISKTKGDWILFLDSDEVISTPVAPSDEFDGYLLKRRDFWLGREIKYGETNIKLLRLAKKNSGRWRRKVHEYWDVRGKIGSLDAEIIHHPHPSVREFISEVAGYSMLHAGQNKQEGKKSSLLKVIFLPILKFLNGFVFKGGVGDGAHGFVIAGIMSFHSFLSWSELWLNSRKK